MILLFSTTCILFQQSLRSAEQRSVEFLEAATLYGAQNAL